MPQRKEIVDAKKELRKATRKLPPHILDQLIKDTENMSREELIEYLTQLRERG